MSNAIVPLMIPKTMQAEIKSAAKFTRLKQAEIMRQSIRLGLPQFVSGFPKPVRPETVPVSK